MQLLFLIIFLFVSTVNFSHSVSPHFLNPTGTYKFNEKTEKRDGEVYGYFGEIRVKLLDKSKIAMSFYICKGAPSYNSGSFVDTLDYFNEQVIYIPEDDSICKIVFHFKAQGIDVTQSQKNLNFGCGFGHAVFADGYFKRISRKTPEIIDLLN
jgi:hypothetical protein